MKRSKTIKAGLVSGVIFVGLLVFLYIIFQSRLVRAFPPTHVACFDAFMNSVQSGYADPELNVPAFELKDVSEFRCASSKGFEQYEITGVDTAGRSFYIHHSGGGMAASGADSYLDHCYKSDGVLVKSVKLVGRSSEPQEGSCAFDENFPASPESSYSFEARL